MRAVAQRVSEARVSVAGEVVARIGSGLLIFLAVAKGDSEADLDYLVEKIIGLRIFDDANGKMNLDIQQVGGSLLVVSQFTLYGDVRRGKRPSFDQAGIAEEAQRLYEVFVQRVRAAGLKCETGRFREIMQVHLVNDGPVTILIDSARHF